MYRERADGMSQRPSSRRPLAGAFRPLRRLAARFALVDETRTRAEEALRDFDRDRVQPVVKRMEEELERVRRENAALLRLAAGPQPLGENNQRTPPSPPGWSTTFSEIERGSRAEVAERASEYLAYFAGHDPVADLGCGRGEFLEVARSHGISSYGVDSDPSAVEACRTLGLDARQEDLFAHLAGLTDEALGGVFCSQVVEHLPADLIPRLMREVARVLGPGGVAVVETPNPASFATHVHSFWRDPTHVRPVPEPALSFAARTAGLVVERVRWLSVPPEHERLAPIEVSSASEDLRAVVGALNSTLDRLNMLLYGPQDYALLLRKPS